MPDPWFWNYSHLTEPFPYGPDTSYEKAAKFLDGGPVEDWGCGTCYAKRFFPNGYLGIDMAPGFADYIADISLLLEPRPKRTNILLRHVLEHNSAWKEILRGAVISSTKLCVVIFTPFGDDTRVINWTENERGRVPDISFRKEDLTRHFPKFTEESFPSNLVYGRETIFYVHTEG